MAVVTASCGRFGRTAAPHGGGERIIVIAQGYTEIIWALGAQGGVVGVDYSSTYPPEVRQLQTVGYHRALSAEGILSLKPTLVIHDNNIGPPQVVSQLRALGVPMKTFLARNTTAEGTKALIREIGAFFHRERRAEELCRAFDTELEAALESAKRYKEHPRVAVIHYGRASNVYLLVGAGGQGDGGAAGKMIEWAGGRPAIDQPGMQRMASPELVAAANPDVVLMTEYGFDRLGGSIDQVMALPGVATSNAARSRRIYRVEEHQLMYFGPSTGRSVEQLARLIHQTGP